MKSLILSYDVFGSGAYSIKLHYGNDTRGWCNFTVFPGCCGIGIVSYIKLDGRLFKGKGSTKRIKEAINLIFNFARTVKRVGNIIMTDVEEQPIPLKNRAVSTNDVIDLIRNNPNSFVIHSYWTFRNPNTGRRLMGINVNVENWS